MKLFAHVSFCFVLENLHFALPTSYQRQKPIITWNIILFGSTSNGWSKNKKVQNQGENGFVLIFAIKGTEQNMFVRNCQFFGISFQISGLCVTTLFNQNKIPVRTEFSLEFDVLPNITNKAI